MLKLNRKRINKKTGTQVATKEDFEEGLTLTDQSGYEFTLLNKYDEGSGKHGAER